MLALFIYHDSFMDFTQLYPSSYAPNLLQYRYRIDIYGVDTAFITNYRAYNIYKRKIVFRYRTYRCEID